MLRTIFLLTKIESTAVTLSIWIYSRQKFNKIISIAFIYKLRVDCVIVTDPRGY